MKAIILLLLGLTLNIFSQDVTVKISANKSEYKKIYSSGESADPLIMNYTLYNNTSDSILIKVDPSFDLEYSGEGYGGYSQCFRLEPIKINGIEYKRNYRYNEYSAFVKIAPNDSLVYEGEFDIFWPCRGMPPSGDWSFNITYRNVLSKEENYFLFKGRYTDFSSKEFIKAWEGELVSNTISLTLFR